MENIFSKYACTVPDKLSLRELWHMTEANRNAFDFYGWYLIFSNLLFCTLKCQFTPSTACWNVFSFNFLTAVGLQASLNGVFCTSLQEMKKDSYQRKLWDDALMEAYLSIVPRCKRMVLIRWDDASTELIIRDTSELVIWISSFEGLKALDNKTHLNFTCKFLSWWRWDMSIIFSSVIVPGFSYYDFIYYYWSVSVLWGISYEEQDPLQCSLIVFVQIRSEIA